MLGIISVGDERRVSLTPLGDRLLSTAVGSDEEREVFRYAVTHAPALRPFQSFLSGEGEVALGRLADRVSALTGMARSTARRRARTLQRWRQQISERARQAEPGLGLASVTEELDRQIAHHNAAAKQRLLDWLSQLDPKRFEQRIAELLRAMGHTQVRVVGGSGDGGVDVEATVEDRWGHGCRVSVQAKRWSRTLSRKPVDELLGALVRRRCDQGILITTSSFSKEARQAAGDDSRLRLVDGAQLVDLMAKHCVLVGYGKYGELIDLASGTRLAERRRDRRLTLAGISPAESLR
jgi:restriction endonuclease Mrr